MAKPNRNKMSEKQLIKYDAGVLAKARIAVKKAEKNCCPAAKKLARAIVAKKMKKR